MFSTTPSVYFFNAPATTENYTLSLHDALPIYAVLYSAQLAGELEDAFDRDLAYCTEFDPAVYRERGAVTRFRDSVADRKSTRLNSSHVEISYAVFCLKKKNTHTK